MRTYDLVKSFIVLIAVVGGFSMFGIRAGRLYRLMRSVQGKSEFQLDRITRRVGVLLKDVLGQANVRRKLMPGLAHTMIFFGFLAVQPHSLELMIKGIVPGLDMGSLSPGLYSAYLFTADILAALVLVGLAYARYRRLMVRPPYLTMGRDANLILVFTSLIIVSFQWINALQTLLPGSPGTFDYSSKVFPVSSLMVGLFGHLHLLAAAPNVFLKPLQREKAIQKSDIENEEAESFGLGKVHELNWKNVLNLYACTECGRCEEQCPAACTGKPLSPKKLIHDFKVDLLDQADKILGDYPEEIKPVMGEKSPITADVLWSCTTCRACEAVCPVNIEHLDFIIETRKHQVLMEAQFPPEMQETFYSLENQGNPWGFAQDTRADWARGMNVPLMFDKPDAGLLYYVGCSGSFDDRGKKTARAMVRVLQRAGVDFAILGPEEACNGDMARRAGNEYLAQMLIRKNAEVLNRYKPKKIVTGCPHCFNVLKNEFPQFGAAFDVVHASQFLLDLYRQGRLQIRRNGMGRLTFHDACYLGRWNGIYDAPRRLLASANAGDPLVEMRRSGETGLCCGAGGGRMFMEEHIGKRIGTERAEEIMRTGAVTVATACPFCAAMLSDGLSEKESDIAVRDIVEIIDDATA
ncbi:MAG: (Fe-S)-binding protein [Desulfosarcinaceae bacterium]